MFKIVIIGAIITIVGLFFLTRIDPNNSDRYYEEYTPIVDVSDSSSTNKVTISGEVVHEGEYYIDPSETLADLIEMAGGVTDNADPKSYDADLVIEDRTNFYIPAKVKIPDTCVSEAIEKVNVNTATYEELTELGFNTKQAQNIVEYREKNGSFKCIEDLTLVYGIGDVTLKSYRDYITIS